MRVTKKMTFKQSLSTDIEEAHQLACDLKQTFYTDPTTQLQVFTAYQLSKRQCCSCGCRHCPYRPPSRASSRSGAAKPIPKFLYGSLDDIDNDAVDIMFFSGGKDSFMALRRLQAENIRPVILLTTFDGYSRRVAHQGLHIDKQIIPQAKALQLPLLGVPTGCSTSDNTHIMDYKHVVEKAIDDKVRRDGVDVLRLVFGDLHLWTVRNWRDKHLSNLFQNNNGNGGIKTLLYYPLWNVSYDLLMDEVMRLTNKNNDQGVVVKFTISAIDDAGEKVGIKVGDQFDRDFIQKLPPHIDAFGENGEFHTLACISPSSPSYSQPSPIRNYNL